LERDMIAWGREVDRIQSEEETTALTKKLKAAAQRACFDAGWPGSAGSTWLSGETAREEVTVALRG